MEELYLNFIITSIVCSASYLFYKNYVDKPESEEILFAGEKLTESEKKDICDSILNDINFIDNTETNEYTDTDASEYEPDNDDFDEDEDEDEDIEDDESPLIKPQSEFCNMPKHPKLRRGYYRIRFEDSSRENDINYISIKDEELFNHIQNEVKKMVLNDKGDNYNDFVNTKDKLFY